MGWRRRIAEDLKARRELDAYTVAAIVFVFAILSVFSDVLSDDLRWAAVLSGIGVLVYRLTLPAEPPQIMAEILHDRSLYDGRPLSASLTHAHDFRVFAPSAVNLLSAHHCETLRKTVLARRGGTVRVVILDSAEETAVRMASRQLDEPLEFPVQRLAAALETTMERLRFMSEWQTQGVFDYRLLPYSPGFSLVLIDPESPGGRVIVEFHGVGNPSPSTRMHLELTRGRDERWFQYWVAQFDHLWEMARPDVRSPEEVD